MLFSLLFQSYCQASTHNVYLTYENRKMKREPLWSWSYDGWI